MLNPEVLAGVADYVTTQTRHVIEAFGPRAPGSAAEREAQAYVADCLAELEPDEAYSESFPVAAQAFMRFQTVAGCLLMVSVGAYWVAPPVALLLGIVAFAVVWYQFIHYRPLLDRFYPETESVNVYARWAPAKETKRRIILNAHTDAAFEWRFHYRWPRAFPWIVRYGLAGLPVAVVAQAVGSMIWLGAPEAPALLYLGAVQAVFFPSFVMALFYTDFSRVVPGANDNLSGVFLALGVVKALRDAGVALAHTEVACLITGSEEAGLRGAKAWAARHRHDFKDCETVILTLDTFHDLAHLTVFDRDLNGTVKNDAAFSALVQQAAKDCGHDIPRASIPLGSTDAAAFTQAGLRATALCAMDPAPAHFYHTRRDTWDDMDRACLVAGAAVVAETIRRFDGAQD